MVNCICGVEFPRDPRLEIECPTCHAKPGQRCRRPSEHVLKVGFGDWHSARKKLAFELFPCKCLEIWEKAQAAKNPQLPLA